MSRFATTRWSLILDARGAPETARPALEEICRAYRSPVLSYVRCSGHGAADAEDLTQEFFARLLERRWDARADPARGRFRSFLLTALKRFLLDQRDAARTLKRGGGSRHAGEDALDDVGDELALSPEAAFERAWAATVLQRAFERLAAEAEKAGRGQLFSRLSPFLAEPAEASEYRELADTLGMRANTLAVSVHRLRLRLRELVREEIADQTDGPESAAVELATLRQALVRGQAGLELA
ncbi:MULTISPECIES: sigma-70 family RNA polymerase sigma factor [unclassified Arenimonas]|uniref:sigma-70 family RNA polymerase sigma factor n=1 Tax=unclassified Arenimonas TaxID=2641713 RepID=UPI00086F33E3|nr:MULTISPECIES: sigma-70 family RNA polymerase sigma factor [unclassified Arenimonas]ODS64513.1 MAG: hypothetical protein ABS41_02115 [Arenimonas sp. SCN 70-307]